MEKKPVYEKPVATFIPLSDDIITDSNPVYGGDTPLDNDPLAGE